MQNEKWCDMIPYDEKTKILQSIDNALVRMKEKRHDNTIHYARLKAKRDAIASGEPYIVVDVTPFIITYIGTLIPDLNIGSGEKRIKARGNKKKAVIEAVMGLKR